MRRAARITAGLIMAIAGGGAAAADASRLALVIGNSAYTNLPALGACAASVNVVSAALKRAGFDVTQRLDPSNGRMGAAIAEFADALASAPGSVAVAYYCGYVVAFDGRMFLLPVSADLERATDALTQGMVSRALINAVVTSNVTSGLVLLDTAVTPKTAAGLALDTLVNPAELGNRALVAANSPAPLPDGPTPLAAALAAGLAASEIETRAMLKDMRDALQGTPGLKLAVFEPAYPTWLRGGPSAPPNVVAVPPPQPLPVPVTAAPAGPTRPTEPAALNELDRRRVQLALQRLGYYAGNVDGITGADTLAAIRRFQHELGAAMTGHLTAEQASRLLADGR